MDLELSGKTALVAAASKGLGRAVARRLAAAGARIIICAREREGVDAVVAELSAEFASVDPIGLVADLTSVSDIERLKQELSERCSGIDVLINNAGGPSPGGFDDLDDADWLAATNLTLMSAVRLTRVALPHMRSQKWGRIVNISSYSVRQPIRQLMLSNSIRLAVTGWAKSLANEVAADGVLVNTVGPGWTATDRMTSLIAKRAEAEGRTRAEIEAEICASIPMGRMGHAEETADVVAFLASERASYVTGVFIPVDGGAVQSAL